MSCLSWVFFLMRQCTILQGAATHGAHQLRAPGLRQLQACAGPEASGLANLGEACGVRGRAGGGLRAAWRAAVGSSSHARVYLSHHLQGDVLGTLAVVSPLTGLDSESLICASLGPEPRIDSEQMTHACRPTRRPPRPSLLNKPCSSSSSSSSSSCHHVCRVAEVEDYQHVQRSCIPFAHTRTFPLKRWRVRQKVNTRRACSSDTAPARLPPCTRPTPSKAHSRERGPAAAAAVA